MANLNYLGDENILEQIEETSNRRRNAPLEFFCEFLDEIWKDNTEEEALQQWKAKVEYFPWYADDALFCLDAIIQNPPANLIELMQEHGWLMLYHEPDEAGEELPYTFEEYLDWLKKMRSEYALIYDNASINEETKSAED